MASTPPINPYQQHYLEIAALEPTGNPPDLPPAAINPSMVVTWPIIIFFSLFITGFLILFFKRLHLFRSVLMVFVVAFLLALLPMAMQSTQSSKLAGIKADSSIVPRQVVVSSVVPTGFVIEWDTDKETAGGINISESADMSSKNFTYPDNALKTHHRLVVLNLNPQTTYFIEVLSETTWSDHSGQPIQITLPAASP